MMKGFRTLTVNGVVGAIAIANSLDWVSFMGDKRGSLIIAGLSFANMVLRYVTNTPVGQKD